MTVRGTAWAGRVARPEAGAECIPGGEPHGETRAGRDGESIRPDGSHCRLRVWFEGHEPLEYRARADVAHHFAMAAHTVGAVVTIDGNVRDDLRPLPCERLWTS